MPSFYEIMIEARDHASGTFQKVAREAEKTSRAVSKASEPKAGLGGLKQRFGEESQFGLGLKTLKGAGAVAGIGIASSIFSDLGSAALELTKEYKKGTLSTREMIGKILEGTPIIGGFFTGLKGLFESSLLLTGALDKQIAKQKEDEESFLIRERSKKQRASEGELDSSFEEFDKSVTAKDDPTSRRRAQFDAEMKRIADIEKKGLESDPTRDNRMEAETRRIAAMERRDDDIAEIGRKAAQEAAQKNSGERTARTKSFFAGEDAEADRSNTEAERMRKQFAEGASRRAGGARGFFDRMKDQKEIGPRFASMSEGQGSGASALARAGNPTLDVTKDSNRTLKETKTVHEAGYTELAGLLRSLITQKNEYKGAQA